MAPLRWEERLDGLTKDTRLDAQGISLTSLAS